MMRRSPMPRASVPLKRTTFKKSAPKIRAGHNKAMLNACRGESCYLAIPGVCRGDVATVVPCHSNQSKHGKGMGIKADDKYTVPGCMHCHAELDQGFSLTREQKAAHWDWAYTQWEGVRAIKIGQEVTR
jgi:hypothetical protein